MPSVDGMRALARQRGVEEDLHTVIETALRRALEHATSGTSLVAAAPTQTKLQQMIGAWDSEVKNTITPALRRHYKKAMEQMADSFGIVIGENIRDQRAMQYTKTVTNRLKNIGDEMFKNALGALRKSLERGEGIGKATKRVQHELDVSMTNAARIARTEAAGVLNAADHSVQLDLMDAGIALSKEWLATGDSRTRHTHASASGQVVPINEPFTVGASELMYPGDPAGKADEVINCRCTTLTVLAD